MLPIKLHDYQEYAKNFIIKTPSAGLFLDMGLGKACDDETIIPTPNGFKRLGDLQVNDYLFGKNGQPTKITAVYKHQNKTAYCVTLQDGRKFICCDEHLIPYCTSKYATTLKVAQLKDLLNNYKTPQKHCFKYRCYIPINNAVIYPSKQHLLHPYFFGVLLSKGYFKPTNPNNSYTEKNIINSIKQELKRLNIIQNQTIIPHIPQSYLLDSIENRKQLLYGLMDTNGDFNLSKQNNKQILNYTYLTTNKQLADDICSLTRSLGYIANQQFINGQIQINIFCNEQIIFNPNKTKHVDFTLIKAINKGLPIVNIEQVSNRNMTCFTVEAKDHLYLINDYIVTHNTLITLSALYEMNPKCHVLIIAPKNIARSTWIDEIEKWQLPLRIKSLITNEKGKDLSKAKRLERYKEVLTAKPTIYLINRELLVDLIEFFKPYFPFPIVVIDEFQSFKSYSSQRFKALKSVRQQIIKLIGLTGTPAPNTLMDLWSQIYLLDQGKRLGPNITTYRNTYFNPGFIVDNYPVTWDPKPGAKEAIYQAISDIVISMENTKLALPPITFNNIYVHLSDKETKLYKTMAKEQVLTINDEEITANNAAVLVGKLSQMASGALYTDENHHFNIIHKQKLNYLAYMLRNYTSPVLIAYYFQSDAIMIETYLKALGLDIKIFDGSREMLQAWNAKQIPIMLLQPLSAGHGLNMQQGGFTLIWYTLPWSLEAYLQTNARIYRQGQTQPVIIHHLMTKNTIDEYILYKLKQKNLSQKELLDAVKATINQINSL